MKPFVLGVPKDPLRQAMCGAMMSVDHVPMPMVRTGAETVGIVDSPRQPFDGLNERIARVATTYCLFGVKKYFFFYFHVLCLIWHVVKRYG